MPGVIDSLWVRLGFQADPAAVEHFKHKIEGLRGSLEKLGALAGIEVLKRIGEFVERAVEGAAKVNDLSEATDVAADKIAAMGKMAVEGSSSTEAMGEAIMSVSRATGAAAAGFPRFQKLFEQLGISAKDGTGKAKDTVTMMGELAAKFAGLGTSERNALAGRLGIDPMIAKMMADHGAEFVPQMQEKAGQALLTAEDYARADETEKSFNRMHGTIGGLTTLVATQLSPWVNKALDAFQNWWKANRPEVVQRFNGLMKTLSGHLQTLWAVLTDVYDVVRRAYEWFDKLGISSLVFKAAVAGIVSYKLGGWAKESASAIRGLGNAFLGLKGGTMPLGAAVAGLLLILEDLWVWKKGGKSFFGMLYNEFPAAFAAAALSVGTLTGAFITMKIQAWAAAAAGAAAAASAAGGKVGALGGIAKGVLGTGTGVSGAVGGLMVPAALAATVGVAGGLGLDALAKQFRLGAYGIDLKTPGLDNFKSSRFRPWQPSDSVDANGRPLWLQKHSATSNTWKIDKVEIKADKGRERQAGQALIDKSRQIADAHNARSPVHY
jgi:hypothetical protein